MFWFRVFERDGASVEECGWDSLGAYSSEEEATEAAIAYRDRTSRNVDHIQILSGEPLISRQWTFDNEVCVNTVWAEEAE